jgi:hypothetical protein
MADPSCERLFRTHLRHRCWATRRLALAMLALSIPTLAPCACAATPCRYTTSRPGLTGYETGGPHTLDNYVLTKGRIDLREFLWTHWHGHKKGVAEARVGTVDRGVVSLLYVIQPDAKGNWGIDYEIDRPTDPPCEAFHVDSLVRLAIRNPDDDLSQTTVVSDLDEIPSKRVADAEVTEPKRYQVLFVRGGKPFGGGI